MCVSCGWVMRHEPRGSVTQSYVDVECVNDHCPEQWKKLRVPRQIIHCELKPTDGS
jgi:hypothetical protein